MNRETANKELVRLLELDYERTASFITGVVGTSTSLRGWAVTIWLAVTGLAFDRGEPALAGLAAIVALAFFLVDGYHAWLYGQALAHAIKVERISALYYGALGGGLDDDDAQLDLQVGLESHRFGVYRDFRHFSIGALRYVRPQVVFRVFYPLLAVVALASAIALYLGGSDSQGTCLVIRDAAIDELSCQTLIVDLRPAASPSPSQLSVPATPKPKGS